MQNNNTNTTRRMRLMSLLISILGIWIGADAEDLQILDYETGEIFNIDKSELYNYNATIEVTYDDDGFIFEYDARYAEIWDAYTCPPNVYCEPCPITYDGTGYCMPYYFIECRTTEEKFKDLIGLDATILEAKYNVIEDCDWIRLRSLHSKPSELPFDMDTFYPHDDQLIYTGYYQVRTNNKGYQFSISLGQFKPATKQFRAYTHMKTRVNYIRSEQDAISEVENNSEAEAIEYFDLQGKAVKSPIKGHLYIKHQGCKTSKIIY